MPRKIEINKQELHKKIKELRNQQKVAEYYGCSITTIRNKMNEHGLESESKLKTRSTLKEKIKEKIIDCLDIYGCALSSQILDFTELDDARYSVTPIKELIEEKKILKVLYRGSDFYVLPGNELEVKRKVRVAKKYIIETVNKFGPIMGRPLVKRIQEDYSSIVNSFLVYRLAKELIEDGKLDSKKKILSYVYFIKGNKKQELKAIQIVKNFNNNRRNSKLEDVSEIFYLEIDKEFGLQEIEKAEWLLISRKIAPFLKIECKGRSYLDLIRMIYFMLIKREIYLRNLKKTNFKDLIPLLRLYDIVKKKNEEHFQYIRNKKYKNLKREILNHQEFCEIGLRNQILNTPDIHLKIQYILSTLFGFDKNVTNKIYSLFKNTVKIGYNISGRSAKGILGGLIYYFSQNFSLGLTPGYIANKLDSTGTTVRARYKEIKGLAPYLGKLKSEKQEVNFKGHEEKEIQSHPKIKSQKEALNKMKIENEDNILYIEDDEEIEIKASGVAHEIKILHFFKLNEDGLYQSNCGLTYRYKSSLLNHYLNCRDCSNKLLKKEEDGFFRCNCNKTYRYAYQFSNHIKKCRDFKQHLEILLNKDKVVKHRNNVKK